WGYSDNQQPYLVMELLDGESLDVLMHNRVFTWKETAALMRQVLEGLQVIHEAGVIHRDIKPGNVFLTRGGVIKLMDFGVARRSGMRTITATGVAVGTLIYMAPEQLADARHVDARADLFSVGLLAYTLLAGTHPFEAPNLDRFIVKLIQGDYKPLRSANPDLPTEVAAWVDRLLRRQPADRFPTAAAARAAMP
ncbi:MAG: serine/threonine-protein kinase, partial [Candidatus Xenobia bacterium]